METQHLAHELIKMSTTFLILSSLMFSLLSEIKEIIETVDTMNCVRLLFLFL